MSLVSCEREGTRVKVEERTKHGDNTVDNDITIKIKTDSEQIMKEPEAFVSNNIKEEMTALEVCTIGYDRRCPRDVKRISLTKQQQIEQLELIYNSNSYVKCSYRCEKCYIGFDFESSYVKHMAWHDPLFVKYPRSLDTDVQEASSSFRKMTESPIQPERSQATVKEERGSEEEVKCKKDVSDSRNTVKIEKDNVQKFIHTYNSQSSDENKPQFEAVNIKYEVSIEPDRWSNLSNDKYNKKITFNAEGISDSSSEELRENGANYDNVNIKREIPSNKDNYPTKQTDNVFKKAIDNEKIKKGIEDDGFLSSHCMEYEITVKPDIYPSEANYESEDNFDDDNFDGNTTDLDNGDIWNGVEGRMRVDNQSLKETEGGETTINYLDSVYKCDKCFIGFRIESAYMKHKAWHDMQCEKVWSSCARCCKEFHSAEEFNCHLGNCKIMPDSPAKWPCTLCAEGFPSAVRLSEHLNTHLEGAECSRLQHTCNICGKIYNSQAKLEEHQYTHTQNADQSPQQRTNSPDDCTRQPLNQIKKTSRSKSRKRPRKPRDQPEQNISPDTLCERKESIPLRKQKCIVEDPLKHHQENDESITPDTEETRQEIMYDSINEEDSIILSSQSDGTSNSCHICKKTFIYKHTLNRHFRIHTGEKPYSCFVCKEQFNQKNNLTRHLRIHTGEKPFLCHICKKTFTQKNNLTIHLKTHAGEKPYSCHLCQEAFDDRSELLSHVKSHASRKPYTCYVCNKIFMQKFYLTRHLRSHTGEKPYSCHVCAKMFSQDCNLYRHLTTHHGEKTLGSKRVCVHPVLCHNVTKFQATFKKLTDGYSCLRETQDSLYSCIANTNMMKLEIPIKEENDDSEHSFKYEVPMENIVVKCEAAVADRTEVKTFDTNGTKNDDNRWIKLEITKIKTEEHTKHTSESVEQLNIQCDKRNKDTESLPDAEVNPDTETHKVNSKFVLKGRFSCDNCLYQTNSKVQLSSHIEAHASSKSFDCNFCYYKTLIRERFKSHMNYHLGIRYTCSTCNKSFSTKQQLTYHMKLHEAGKLYSCEVCKKAFINENRLSLHLKLHKPYTCDVCEKTFYQKGALTKHIRIHTGERPYPCHLCEKAFHQKCALNNHVRIHTGERPYTCNVCKKSFNQRSILTSHLRIHGDVKPYPCRFCEKTFNSPSNLTCHLRIHTGEKPYKCHLCTKAFKQQSVLNNHLKKIHTDVKLYSCQVCKLAFNDRTSLTNHLKTHSGDKLYSCQVCKKVYNQRSSITRHMKSHTRESS